MTNTEDVRFLLSRVMRDAVRDQCLAAACDVSLETMPNYSTRWWSTIEQRQEVAAWPGITPEAAPCRISLDAAIHDAQGKSVSKASLIFHDLRRSAVRNLDRDGITQSVVMAITGHTTASVYRRYRIVNEDDIRAALERVQTGNRARKVVKLAQRPASNGDADKTRTKRRGATRRPFVCH